MKRHALPGLLLAGALCAAGASAQPLDRDWAATVASTARPLRSEWQAVLRDAEQPALRRRLDRIQFDTDRSAAPQVRSEALFGQLRVTLSVGWAVALEQLLLAETIGTAAAKPACADAYGETLASLLSETRQPARGTPRFADFVRASGHAACRSIPRAMLDRKDLRRNILPRFDELLRHMLAAQVLQVLQADQPLAGPPPAWACQFVRAAGLRGGIDTAPWPAMLPMAIAPPLPAC